MKGSAVVRAVSAVAPFPILGFHRDWLRRVFSPDCQVGVLSCPRGSGKTWITSQIAAVSLLPGSPLWRPGLETIATSQGFDSSRTMLRQVSETLAPYKADYHWLGLTGGQRLAVTHKASGDNVPDHIEPRQKGIWP